MLLSDNYLSFSNEITFYAAISRKDREWLEELYARFKDLAGAVWSDMPDDVKTGELVENFVMPTDDAKEEEVFAVERMIFESDFQERPIADTYSTAMQSWYHPLLQTLPFAAWETIRASDGWLI